MKRKSPEQAKRIMETAICLFRRDGYENVSVQTICRNLDIPRSTFYNYFSGKEAVIAYMLQKVKQDFELNLPDFIKASNDFERIWLLTDAFVSLAEENGLELNRIIFMLELKNSCMFFDLLSTFNDWLIQLTANCQSLGIIRNQTLPQKLVPLQLTLAKGIFFEWVRTDGSFSLKETMRREIEVLLDVLPEYRR